MSVMDFINVVVTALFFAFWYWFGYWDAKRKYRVDMEHITAYRKQLRDAKAEAWDDGARWAAVECGVIDEDEPWLTPSDNPYREETE